MGIDSYRQLKVWQTGMDLSKAVYVLTRGFPKHEQYGMSGQMRRAAVSIPANIAEGHARDSTRDFLRHLSIAQGSLAELETFLILAPRLDYCEHSRVAELLDKCAEEGRMLNGLQTRLKERIASDL